MWFLESSTSEVTTQSNCSLEESVSKTLADVSVSSPPMNSELSASLTAAGPSSDTVPLKELTRPVPAKPADLSVSSPSGGTPPSASHDFTFTVDHAMTVFEVLDDARQSWYFIGVGLGCKISDLEEIHRIHSSDQRMCLLQMLIRRIRQGGLTRSVLCNTLRGKFVERDDIAKKIEVLTLPSRN